MKRIPLSPWRLCKERSEDTLRTPSGEGLGARLTRWLIFASGGLSSVVGAAGVVATTQFLQGCGTNSLKARAPASDVESAQILLEEGKTLEARILLLRHLERAPDDAQALALLAASYAADCGLSIIAITEKSLSTGQKSQQDLLTEILPEPTEVNLTNSRLAKVTILKIPEEVRTADMKFAATLYVAAYALLLLEQFKENPTVPTPEQAAEFLGSIDTAATLAAENNIPTAKIQEARDRIAAEPGATDSEKLNSYLEKLKQSNGGALPPLPSSPAPSPAPTL